MAKSLPYSNYSWLNESEIANLDVYSFNLDSKFGYALEVDLEYPERMN